ncbi:MAG TPA: hypothetical protein PL131_13190 [Methylotenera sp.]|nr:hypothetical protein [Methylotenera sp.]
MLLPREQSPWNCAYVLGAAALTSLEAGAADLMVLQSRMEVILKRRVSPTQTLSAAAWLFLLDKVMLDDKGQLFLCN